MKCLEEEKKLGLDFVLLTGDLTHDGTAEDYGVLRDAFNNTLGGIPWIALPGNHDIRDAFCRGLLGIDSKHELDSVYEVNGLRIITLDSGAEIAGVVSSQQMQWLDSVLSVHCAKGSILAIHHPLIPNQEGLGIAQFDSDLLKFIAKSDVIGIFCGHTHRNYSGNFAGKPYFTADSMSYAFEESGEMTSIEAFAAYNRVVLHDGSISVQVRQLAPAPTVAACFPTDTMSKLFEK
jgi:3',5'-cyclic AMP phosphodiesterase CpdA